jgi:hypothetical protein
MQRTERPSFARGQVDAGRRFVRGDAPAECAQRMLNPAAIFVGNR